MKLRVEKRFEWRGEATQRVRAVMRMFGVSVERLNERGVTHRCELRVEDGDIVYITGPSGAGKSVLLRELAGGLPRGERINLNDIELPASKAVIDCIEGDIIQALRSLSMAGLSDVFCILNQPRNLSEGQQYRFRLAAAISSGKKYIIADEFCSNLDRITAAVISYNVRRFAKRNGTTFFLASCHEDILADLQPDVLIVKELTGEAEVTYKEKKSTRHKGTRA